MAGLHSDPVENAWNSRIHEACKAADAEGLIEYKYSESVANTDYPGVIREYAAQGTQLIVGEVYGVEKEARAMAKEFPKVAFLCGSSGGPSSRHCTKPGFARKSNFDLAGHRSGLCQIHSRVQFWFHGFIQGV